MVNTRVTRKCTIIVCLALMAAETFGAGTWTCMSPTANQNFSSASDIGAMGTTDQPATTFVAKVVDDTQTIRNSAQGTSYAMGGPNYMWGATVPNPTGGFPKHSTCWFIVKGSDGGGKSVVITFGE